MIYASIHIFYVDDYANLRFMYVSLIDYDDCLTTTWEIWGPKDEFRDFLNLSTLSPRYALSNFRLESCTNLSPEDIGCAFVV